LLQRQELVLAKYFAHLLAKVLGSMAAVSALILGLALFTSSAVYAQNEASETLQLPAEEVARLREILNRPIEPNSLNQTKEDLYKLKDNAAWRLGDMVKREEVLREWAQTSNDGKWTLRDYLAGTEKRAEAYAIGKELIEVMKFPPSAARIRITLANNYIDDSNLKEAGKLLDQAEKTIKEEWRSVPLRGPNQFWMSRAEMEFHNIKALYLWRTSRWVESVQSSELSIRKGKEMIKNDAQADERQKQFAKNYLIYCHNILALTQMAAGQYANAEWSLREGYRLAKEFKFSDNQLIGLFNRYADLRNALGLTDEAKAYAEKSLTLLNAQGYKPGSMNWVFAINRVSLALTLAGKWKDALNQFDLVDQEVSKLKTQSAQSRQTFVRSLVYMNNHKATDALQYLEPTFKWHIQNFGENHYQTAVAGGLLASALSLSGQPALARPQFEQAMRNITAPEVLTGDFAETAFQKAAKRFVFQTYLQLLSKTASQNPKDAETIFELADYLNASSVQQALNDAAVRSGIDVPGLSDIIRKEQDAKGEMTSLLSYLSSQSGEGDARRITPQVVEQMRVRLRELEAQRRTYKEDIAKRFPDYFQLIQPRSPAPSDIAKQLKPDEIFVSVLPMDGETFVWGLNAHGEIHFHRWSLGDKQINALVDRVRQTLDVAGYGTQAPAFDAAGSHQIYNGVLGPLEKMLAGKKHLILATSGPLAKLPLAVLVRAPYPTKAAPHYLIQDMAVSHVPTASGWLALKRFGKVPVTSRPLVAWGDPVFEAKLLAVNTTGSAQVRSAQAVRSVLEPRTLPQGGLETGAMNFVDYAQLAPLPETRDEVLELAKIMGSLPDQDLFLGPKATRKSVLQHSSSGQLAQKQVVVFATHGLLAGDLPNLNQPALAMAVTSNPTDSPLLTLEDVLSLKLNADWVVLSACNTAGADGKAQEALSGLARGFFYAGSRSLLVTHWSVESESAMLLTTRTFEAYKTHPDMLRAEALRQAMLQTMKDKRFAHPAFWAPYALVGEGGR
jgi:CHAT domain-containing protein